MQYLDIIILAAIAAFFLGRLWLVLGRKDDDEPERPNPFDPRSRLSQDEDDVVVLPKQLSAPKADPQAITQSGLAALSLAGTLDQIKSIDPEFEEKQFLSGAKAAFVKIVEAFMNGDLSPAADLLSPPVRESFQKAIDERKKAGEKLEGRIDRVTGADIIAARLEETMAFLTVEFSSYQENIIRDATGKIVAGEPGKIEDIRDEWVFARDLKSEDPNWQLVETHA